MIVPLSLLYLSLVLLIVLSLESMLFFLFSFFYLFFITLYCDLDTLCRAVETTIHSIFAWKMEPLYSSFTEIWGNFLCCSGLASNLGMYMSLIKWLESSHWSWLFPTGDFSWSVLTMYSYLSPWIDFFFFIPYLWMQWVLSCVWCLSLRRLYR